MKGNKHTHIWRGIVLVLFMFNCKQQYLPPVLKSNRNYLVVEGVIVAGNDSTIINLSRTSNISDSLLPPPEPGDQVIVEGQDSSKYLLTDRGDGSYFSAGLNLDVTKTYRLQIQTPTGFYQSNFVPVKSTPPIDSLGWYQDTANNVQISVNTHDPSNNSRYYRWNYTETWNYQTDIQSLFDWVNNTIVVRDSTQQIFNCWSSDQSSTIEIASSAKLSQDVIAQQNVATVPYPSEKIGFTYSILVRQYVLTQDAYNFWQTLQNTTQQLGSLFDAQPSQIQGNIVNTTNPANIAIGYVSASTVQTKRIFINRNDLRWQYTPYYSAYPCTQRDIPPDSVNYFLPPTGRFWVLVGQVTGSPDYIIAPLECADCRVHGGTNIKPSYWP